MLKPTVCVFSVLCVLVVNVWFLTSCSGDNRSKKLNGDNGGSFTMKSYCLGRFKLDVPLEMKEMVQAQNFRYVDINDFEWPHATAREKARTDIWESKLSEINALDKPRNVSTVVMEQRDFSDMGQWSKGVKYYGDYIIPQRHFWTVLVDYGKNGLWLTVDGADDEMSLKNLHNLMKHYSVGNGVIDAFHLRYGAIDLPYLEQEKTYARFEGHPLDLKLEVDMNETHEVEKHGLAERLAAAIMTRFVPGVDVDKIRARTRMAAGLEGEELVTRMSARGEDTQIQFTWEYRGEVDSGERPEIQITMEAPDGHLDEKLKVWDAVLDSFKPMYATRR